MKRDYLSVSPWVMTAPNEAQRIVCYIHNDSIAVQKQTYSPQFNESCFRQVQFTDGNYYDVNKLGIFEAFADWGKRTSDFLDRVAFWENVFAEPAFIEAANAADLANQCLTIG